MLELIRFTGILMSFIIRKVQNPEMKELIDK